jgi:hypothetical protein
MELQMTAAFPVRAMTTIVLTPPAMSGPVQLVVAHSHFAEGDGTVFSTFTITNKEHGHRAECTSNLLSTRFN